MPFNTPILIPNIQGSAMTPSNTTAPVAITNLATGGVIGTSSATVDVNTVFEITQTTANRIITLPTPTITTGSKVYVIKSSVSSTTSFSLYGINLNPNQAISVLWNGSIYSPINEPVGIETIQTVTTTTTLTRWDSAIFVDSTLGAITLTIPVNNTSQIGKELIIIKTAGTNLITIALNGSAVVGRSVLTLNEIGSTLTFKSVSSTQVSIINQLSLNTPNSPINNLPPIAIANLATGGNIGTALTTVDVNSYFTINQTTTGQTVTIPTPTNATASKVINLRNIGTASFSIYNNTVQAGAEITLGYNGTSWLVTGGAASTTKIDVANILAVNGNILTAATSVDIANTLAFTQTTNNITAVLLNPTTTTVHKVITLENLPASTQSIRITAVGGDTFDLGVAQSLEVWWNGTSWRLMNPAQVLSEYGEVVLGADITTNTANTAFDILSFTLPTAGVWEVEAYANTGGTSINTSTFFLTDNLNNILTGSGARGEYPTASIRFPITIPQRITTTGSQTFKFRAMSNVTNALAIFQNTSTPQSVTGSTKVVWKKISGFSSVIGQSIDYVTSHLNAFQTGITAPTDVIFNSLTTGNIPLNTTNGVFSLIGGKTYELDSMLALFINSGTATANASITYQWVDADTNIALITNKGKGISTAFGATTGNIGTGNIPANLIYTPIANQTIKLRITNVLLNGVIQFGLGFGSSNDGSSYATIKQLGTSAIITTPISILQLENQGATAQAATTGAAGNPTGILWFASLFSKGSKITWTPNSGTITLQGGVNGTTYRLTGKVATTGASDLAGSYIFYRFYNVGANTQIGSEGYNADPDSGAGNTWNEIPSSVAYAYITVPAGTSQQIRLVISSSSATPGNIRQQAGQTSINIEEIEG